MHDSLSIFSHRWCIQHGVYDNRLTRRGFWLCSLITDHLLCFAGAQKSAATNVPTSRGFCCLQWSLRQRVWSSFQYERVGGNQSPPPQGHLLFFGQAAGGTKSKLKGLVNSGRTEKAGTRDFSHGSPAGQRSWREREREEWGAGRQCRVRECKGSSPLSPAVPGFIDRRWPRGEGTEHQHLHSTTRAAESLVIV